MSFREKISLNDIIILSVGIVINIHSIYTGTTYMLSGPVRLVTDPLRFKIGLFLSISIVVGYAIWIFVRKED